MKTTWIIICREFVERIKQRTFIVGTILSVAFIVGLSFFPRLAGALARSTATKMVVVVPDLSARSAIDKALSQVEEVRTFVPGPAHAGALPGEVKKELEAGKYDAALVAYRDRRGALGFSYYPKKSSALEETGTLKSALLKAVLLAGSSETSGAAAARALDYKFSEINLNDRYKDETEELLSKGLVYFLLVILYIAVLMYGVYVAQGVIEEKANRIMEIMIGAVRPSQLLAGKIFGIGAVALVQLLINALAAGAMLLFAASRTAHAPTSVGQAAAVTPGIVAVPPATLVYLLVFFLLGFFTYATLFAGVGSLLTKPEEVQQYSSIFMMPIIGAYILAIYALVNPDLPLVIWMSMVPMFSPMLMFARIATTAVPLWQLGVSIVASLVAIWVFTLVAGKLYRVGVLMYGQPPKPLELWRALRAHS
ncbi:MAG: ABC transporter permease [Candidatus Eremiobacteraeota bacterium]|nr:ABC transporter permease [Candidatus Eremiobacteraeota bacterium]MBC5827047.1 ABC transporter permease [Candidatus Eremiobacteraeota bacterium]